MAIVAALGGWLLLLFLSSLDESDALVVPEVVYELDLLPLVDQLLADEQELIDGAVHLVFRVVLQSLLEICVEGSVGHGVLRWVVSCNETVQQVLERLMHVPRLDRMEVLLLHQDSYVA